MKLRNIAIHLFVFLFLISSVFAVIDWNGADVKGFYNYEKLNANYLKDWSPMNNPAQLYGTGEDINFVERYINFTGTFWYATDNFTGLGVGTKTLCSWLKATQDIGNSRMIITTGILNVENAFIMYINAGQDWEFSQFGASLIATRPPIDTDTLFCAVYKGSNDYEIYYNSTSQITGSLSTSYVDDVTYLGTWNIIGEFPLIDVTVYSFMIFDRELTPTEIADLSNQGRFYNPYYVTPTPPTPVTPVQSTSSILVENLFGNYLLLSLFGLLLVVGILMFIRTPKEVVMIIGGLLILGLVSSALFPKWILAIVIIFIGLFIGIFLLRMFFKHY